MRSVYTGLETPPQAWGRPALDAGRDEDVRNTPTGVGKTFAVRCVRQIQQKHPHRRGEDFAPALSNIKSIETPPQAWGRLAMLATLFGGSGNTPTGVGKTASPGPHILFPEKHPHRRGEDCEVSSTDGALTETPPQAWGRLRRLLAGVSQWGNTPTGVGKTL